MMQPRLELSGISKGFGATQALRGVGLRLFGGEIHALMGQNGAGKSTLIKVLTGVHAPDAGRIVLDGRAIAPATPLQAQQLGISTVYQEVNLCPNLSVAENIFAGRYPRRGWLAGRMIDWPRMQAQARELLAGLNLHVDVGLELAHYPVAVQQMVAIARALAIRSQVLILDEPTSSLDDGEVQQLFAVLRRLRDQGLAILFVTHFLDQVYAVSDRITVLRNGERVGEHLAAELPAPALVTAMVGREVVMSGGRGDAAGAGTGPAPAASTAAQPAAAPAAPAALRATGLARRGQLQPVDVALHPGEIVGIGGLLGSGRTELARLLFGLDRAEAGRIEVQGRPARWDRPAQAIRRGLALCPEDRKAEGIVAELSVRENVALALQARRGLWRNLGRAEQEALALRYIAALGIKTADIETPIGRLSGGNQQKAVLARWLATDPQVLLLDEPTRGIDVAAKQEIMDEITRLAREGMAVMFISSEMAEVVRLSDRIVVMRNRAKAAELPGGSSEQAIYDIIAGA